MCENHKMLELTNVRIPVVKWIYLLRPGKVMFDYYCDRFYLRYTFVFKITNKQNA